MVHPTDLRLFEDQAQESLQSSTPWDSNYNSIDLAIAHLGLTVFYTALHSTSQDEWLNVTEFCNGAKLAVECVELLGMRDGLERLFVPPPVSVHLLEFACTTSWFYILIGGSPVQGCYTTRLRKQTLMAD